MLLVLNAFATLLPLFPLFPLFPLLPLTPMVTLLDMLLPEMTDIETLSFRLPEVAVGSTAKLVY